MESFEYFNHIVWITQSFRWVYSIDGGRWSRGFWDREECVFNAMADIIENLGILAEEF